MQKKICISFIVLGFLLITSILPGIPGSESFNETDEQIVFITLNDQTQQNLLSSYDLTILETYDHALLAKIQPSTLSELKTQEFTIKTISQKKSITLNGHHIDFNKEPTKQILTNQKETNKENESRLYLIHLIGPVAKTWKPTLQQIGVSILNYVHNQAYRVWMNPDQAEKVKDLPFVNDVSIYPNELKIQKNLKPGKVVVCIVPQATTEQINLIYNKTTVIRQARTDEGIQFICQVDSKEMLNVIADINEVLYIIAYTEPRLLSEIESQIIGGGAWLLDDDNNISTPYREHGSNGAYINQLGYNGNGVTIAIADTGLGNGTIGDAGHVDFTNRIIGGHCWGESEWEDTYGHGTHCTGLIAGNTYEGTNLTYDGYGSYYLGQGLASGAQLYSLRILYDRSTWVGPSGYFDILKVAKRNASAYVHSNSWGSSTFGQYKESDHAYDRAVRDADNETNGNQPLIITVSAGNSGPNYQTTGSPANAKNVISVGSTETYMPDAQSYGYDGPGVNNPNKISSFSSRGWTADNRIKPDVVAPGETILSTSSSYGGDNLFGLYTNDNRYEWSSGTSMSNPLVAGAAAVIVQWYNETYNSIPSPAMVKALLINTAQDLNDTNGNTAPIPNRNEGWGMVNISKLVYPIEDPVRFYVSDQDYIFNGTSQIDKHYIISEKQEYPLKITLVWTDKEAQSDTNNSKSLKNDLNLKVESPNGRIYKGNAFIDGWTQHDTYTISDFDTDEDGWDDTNNVENVYIHPDDVKQGTYTISISAYNISENATNSNTNSITQDYALVIYNARNQLTQNPPSQFSAISTNRSTITLNWTNDGDNKTYIEYNTINVPWNRGEGIFLENSTNTTCNHTDLSFNTTYYYQAWSYNDTSQNFSEEYTNAQAKTQENIPPVFRNEHPTDQSTGNNISLQWNVTITDPENDLFNWSINCSNGNNAQTINDINGSKTLSLSSLDYETEYTVWVNATDEYGAETKEWYTFTTKDEPWENTCPSSTFINPANKSKNVDVTITQWSVDIIDLDGNTTNGSITCSNAESMQWAYQPNGTRILNLNTLDYNMNYTIYLNYTDGHCTLNETFWFITRDQFIPDSPINFNAQTQNRFRIDLSWNPTDDITYIEYNTTNSWPKGEGELLVNDSTSSYQHNGLDSGITYYYKAWSYNTTDNTWSTVVTDHNTTLINQPPSFTNPSPGNESTGQELSLNWTVSINDIESDNFNWSIQCNNEQENGSTHDLDGLKQLELTSLSYNTTYTIWVNATDEYDAETKEWYTFTTKDEPWINTCPISSDELPINKSLDVSITLSSWSVNINDTDENNTRGSIHCSNGDQIEWFDQEDGTQSLMLSALEYNTNYTIWLNYTDNHCIVNETYWFITEPCYSLNIVIQGNGTVTKNPDLLCYSNGTNVELNASADIGWEFNHWFGDISGEENPIILSMTNDYDITAVFTRKGPFTLTNTTNGTGSGMIEVHPLGPYYYGDMITVWANASQGSNFTAFNGDLTGTETPQNLIIDGNKSINAQFTLNNYQLTINSTNGGSVTNPGEGDFIYNYGSTIDLEARPIKGHHFVEWNGDNQTIADTKNNITTITIPDDSTITAQFARNGPFTLNLTKNSTGSGSIEVNKTGPYYYGDTVKIWANASLGSTFTGFSGDLQGTNSPQTVVITENKTVNAEFTLDCYQLNISIIGNGYISHNPNQTCYTYDTEIKLTPNAEFPWYFNEWAGPNATELVNNGDGSWNITILNDTELTAIFLEQWLNACPVSNSESPTNKSTGKDIEIGEWSVFISDLDGNKTNGSIHCSNGDQIEWFDQENGTQSLMLSALEYNTNYTIWLNYTDNHCIVNETFWFMTRDQYDPIQPADFIAETKNRFQIDLSWIPTDDFTYIEYNTTNSWLRGEGEFLQNDTSQSYQHIGLNPGTTYYYQAWSYNTTDNSWSTFATDFNSTIINQQPLLINPIPGNESENQGLFFTWIVDINDKEGDRFNWSIECNNEQKNSSNEEINGTKKLLLTDLAYNTQYTIWVNATDEYAAETKEWYTFTTKDEPWENTCPVSHSETPANKSIDVNNDISEWSVSINDFDGNTTSGSIHCSNGDQIEWFDRDNSTQTLDLGSLDYNMNYTIYLNYTDGQCFVNETFWFITRDQFIPNPPITFKAATLDRFQMNLSWTKADNADIIIVECKGEEIYNGTGNNTIHTGLLPNSTYHYQARSYNLTDKKLSGIVTDQNTTKVNYPPDFYVTDIENSTTNTLLSVEWNITITDVEGDTFNWSIECNNSQNNNDIYDTNGTKKLVISGLAYSTTYTIWVNATDEYGAETNAWYTFTTKDKPFQNSCPVSNSVTPTNTSEDVSINVGQWSVDITDANGNKTSGNITCSNGQDTNWSNQENGTQTLDLISLNYNTKYTIYLNYTDGQCLVNETFWFITSQQPTNNNPGGGGTGGGGSAGILPPSNQNPIANATVDKNTGYPNEIFTFNASSSKDSDGEIVNYTWDFDDGSNKSTNQTMITHKFTNTGVYQVMLTVIDEKGGTGSLEYPIIIDIIQANNPPKDLIVTPEDTWTHQNKDLLFIMSATDQDDNDTIRFEIDWGDENKTISEKINSGQIYEISHAWESYGSYPITIIAYDETNATTETYTLTILVDIKVLSELNGWIIDVNGDGVFDQYKDLTNSTLTNIQEKETGNYLIDANNDGIWDYDYQLANGNIHPLNTLKQTEEDESFPLWGIIILIILAILGFIGLLFFKGIIYIEYEEE